MFPLQYSLSLQVDSDKSPDFSPNDQAEEKFTYNFNKYPETISMAMRSNISPNTLSNIMNCLFMDLGLEDHFVCASKLRLHMKKLGKELTKKTRREERLQSLWY